MADERSGERAHGGWIAAGTPEFRRVTWSLFAASFSVFTLLYFVQPIMPLFASDFGIGPATSSLVLSASTETLAFALLVSGPVSDRFGRKPMIVVSLMISALLTVATALAPSFGWLVAARVLVGISLSGVQAVGMAYLAEEMRPDAFGRAFGLFIGGNVVGGMAGRLGMSLAVDYVDWRIATVGVGLVGLVASFCFLKLLPPSRNFRRQTGGMRLAGAFADHLKNPVLLMLFCEGFLLMGGFVNVFNYLTFRLVAPPFSLSQTVAGLVFVVYLTGTLSSALSGRLTDRYGPARVFWPTLVVTAVGLALTLPASLATLAPAIAIYTFGFFAAHATASGWVSRSARHDTALAASLYLFFYYQGSSIVGFSGGMAWSAFGWAGTAGLTGILLIVAFALAAKLRTRLA
ncbi:MFS transporter [Pararhizobium mangrovi]|uniref:MFS transporter n=1 Tax=Pararhizobium mangrovi TaxID=2590452 RepID=A0A506TXF4_9HYPH|nr:MFS transporter [Pararhizobium mangrovi]TPW26190.1 MFS transporter [Pararhizobium mangrovi]